MLAVRITRQYTPLVCVLLIGTLPFFFMGGPAYYSAPLYKTLWDSGHIIFFMGLVFVLREKIHLADWRYSLSLAIGVLGVGSLIEIIQQHTGRDGNWQDVLRNLVGIWLGIFWLQKNNRWVAWGRFIGIMLLVPTVTLVLLAAWSQYRTQKQFPQIANFESPIDTHSWKGRVERVSTLHTNQNHSLKIHLTTEMYSGASLNTFFNTWQGYKTLTLDVYNPDSQPIDLILRVNDIQHEKNGSHYNDRFNMPMHLTQGWNYIKIPVAAILYAPAARQIHLHSISSMAIFALKLPKERDIYVDNIKLE